MQPPPVYHPLLSSSLSIPISLSLPPPVFTFFPRSIYSPFPRNTSIFFQIILDRFFHLFSLPVPCLSVSEESRDTWAAFCIIRTWFSGTVNTKKSLVATSRWRQASLSTSLNAFLDTCSSGNDFLLIVVRYGAKWNTYLDAGGEGEMAGTPEKAPAWSSTNETTPASRPAPWHPDFHYLAVIPETKQGNSFILNVSLTDVREQWFQRKNFSISDVQWDIYLLYIKLLYMFVGRGLNEKMTE